MFRYLFLTVLLFASTLLRFQPALAEEIYDPWENFNRAIFWFNDQLDIYFLEPVARGYAYITPDFVETGVSNFFSNLRYPSFLVSDIVQLKFEQAGVHTGRFLLNSTVGLGGLIDVAKHVGLEPHEEDFGIALGYHGVPHGPYLVLPIFGPSSVRDAIGRGVDAFLDPLYYLGALISPDEAQLAATLGTRFVEAVDTRAGLLEAVELGKKSALDFYLFSQSAYYQHRLGLVYDGEPPEEEEWIDEEENLDAAETIEGEVDVDQGAPEELGDVP